MEITLDTGITVQLRRIDVSAGTPMTLREALNSPFARAGALNAQEGGELLRSLLGTEGRPEEKWPGEMQGLFDAQRGADVATLARGCASPTLDELLRRYGGDVAAADLGLGPDFQALLSAIQVHSGLTAPTEAELTEARLFLREWAATVDALGKRYGRRPSDFAGFPIDALERERMSMDLGVYYWARGEESKDEWWRKSQEEVGPKQKDE